MALRIDECRGRRLVLRRVILQDLQSQSLSEPDTINAGFDQSVWKATAKPTDACMGRSNLNRVGLNTTLPGSRL